MEAQLRELVKDVQMPRNEDTLIVRRHETYESPARPITVRTYRSIEPRSAVEPNFWVFVQPSGRCNGCALALGHLSVEFGEKVDALFDSTPKEQWPTLSLDGIFNELGISRLRYCCRSTLAFPKIYTYNELDTNQLKNTSIQTLAMRNCPVSILSSVTETESESLDDADDGEQEFTSVKVERGYVLRSIPIVYDLMA